MSTKRDNLKAKLLAEAEAAIDKMLSDERLSEHMTMSEIESVVGVSEVDFRQRVLKEIVTMQEEKDKATTTCPLCGKRARNKGQHSKRLMTLRGEVEMKRAYYYCKTCQKGFFPPR